jgi:hypothetical protein
MGADFVKIHSDDFPPEGFAALMDEGRKQQLIVGGHLPFLTMTMRDAVKSGVKFFEHGTLLVLGGCSKSEKQINDECAACRDSKQPMSNAERMHRYALTFDEGWTNELSSELVKNDVWVTPTLIVLRQLESIGRVDYSHHPQRKYLSSGFWQAWEPTGGRPRPLFSDDAVNQIAPAQEKAAAMIKVMHSAGVGLLARSDCSWSNPYTFPGWSLHQELELLVQSGLSPMEVLQTATRNPARFLGELRTNGTVEGRRQGLRHGGIHTRVPDHLGDAAHGAKPWAQSSRTTRQEGYAISQKKRKRIEECFGWLKTIALLRKVRHRGTLRVDWVFTFACAAYIWRACGT